MLRRFKWKEHLQQTTARSSLRDGRPDDFPLQEVKALTDELLRASYTGFLQTGVQPCTPEADEILALELAPLKGRLRHYESGLLAMLHAFSPGEARNRLVCLTPDPSFANEHFDDELAIYVQCVIIARKARGHACKESECYAARELFSLIKAIKRRSFEHDPRRLPKIWGLLQLCGQGSVEELIPLNVVTTVVTRSSYGKVFREEVARLQDACLWSELHDMVGGAADLVQHPKVHSLVAAILPANDMKALIHWRPNHARIKLWSSKLKVDLRAAAQPILVLEGPDSTGEQRATLRHSCPGPFLHLDGAAPVDAVLFFDKLLDAFDTILTVNPEAIEWILFTCARKPETTTRAMVQDALDALALVHKPGHDAAKLIALKNYILYLEDSNVGEPGSRVATVAAAIPIISSSEKLQLSYGKRYSLELRASNLLTEAQQRLCVLIGRKPVDGRQLALRVRALGRAMLEAEWMHSAWRPSYMAMLRRLPTEAEIRKSFELIQRVEHADGELDGEDMLQKQRDFLAERVAGSYRPGHTPNAVPPEVEEESPWLNRHLDPDRAALRENMMHIVPNLPIKLLESCLEQSLKPIVTDDFIRDLNYLLGDTDQACVNLANFLGPRMVPGTKRTNECWANLLMHMMRQRPPGLMERCDQQLTRETWCAWVKNMQHLYGDTHLDPAGKLGFTAEAFARLTKNKRPPMRVVSAASTPPGGASRRLHVNGNTVARSSTTAAHRRNALSDSMC